MKYNFKQIEKKWQKKWEENKIFEVDVDKKKKKFYVLEMYPYPSGMGLHIGHAFNYTIGDILARFKRMNGFNVLYPMGYDSFGLPAENEAIKIGEHPKKTTDKAIANYIKQQKNLGLSYDWSKILESHSENYYKWNQLFFLKFLEKGLAYRKKSAVNWCPKCETVLANEQVHQGKCWRHENTEVEVKHLEQWFLKITDYADELLEKIDSLDWPEKVKTMQKNWIGKSYGTEIDFEIENPEDKISNRKFPIFTTRPDTIYGVTFMVISAQHPRLMEFVNSKQKREVEKFLKKIKSVSEKEQEFLDKEGVFAGSYAINPITKEKVPIWVGNFVVADYGSGMVMAVPAHDQRDFEFAKKYGIEIKPVVLPSLLGAVAGCENDIESEFRKLEIEFLKKDSVYFIKSNSNKRDDLFKAIQKNFKEDVYSDVYIDREVYVITKENIYNLSNKNELECAQKEIDKKEIPKEFSDLRKIKKEWELGDFEEWNFELNKAYTSNGILINSSQFNSLSSEKAKEEITKFLEKKNLGRKKVQFKLRDWLISRQRYWGTPIPIIYCDKCGIVPVAEKDLPVKLPMDVEFGKGNPLATNKKFVNVKCPKCGAKARRETDTMDTFVDSSWYYLRYPDNKNKEEPFDKKIENYWLPVDQYIGGVEHATMHLLYARFWTKALRDLGYVKFDEPFTKLFNQGMLLGEGGEKMSKSKGNIILPEVVSEKYGIDTARFFLISLASPDKAREWSDKGVEGSLKFTNKVIDYIDNVKIGKSDSKIESKLNKTIKEVTEYIEDFKYNLAVIKIRDLFNSLPEITSKEVLEKSLKLLHPFCPHITEELWEKIGNKNFISLEKWPICDEKKINEKFEKEELAVEKLAEDINRILKIVQGKTKCYIYVLPDEKFYSENLELLKRKTGIEISIFSVSDKNKYDPENKSKKVKPNRPGIYLE